MAQSRTMRTWGLVTIAALVLSMIAFGTGSAAASNAGALHAVVVTAASVDDAAAAVSGLGGVVDSRLELVGGVSARVPADAREALERRSDVEVTPDIALHFQSVDADPGPHAGDVQLAALNPPEHWSSDTGAGVGVALLDTGVLESPELAGRVVHGPDYSGDGDGVDRYGHGTFMAGLIAGDPSGSGSGVTPYGVAPGAHVVSVKLAGREGVTTLSTVLDAIGWVVTNQDEYGIRVMNLSIGVPTNRAPQADPLSAAVQAAWSSGITVVAAAGNEGAGTVTSPGRDPWIITVGSTDTVGTATTSDDTVPDWSGEARIQRNTKPELLAPGVSVVSLRAPGSHVDESNPHAQVGEHHFRGSGTSMSAALVSGAAAALVEMRPWATPDDVKGALVSTGTPIAGSLGVAVDLAAADAAEPDDSWRQDHHIVFNRLGHRLRDGMPWARRGAPSAEDTWERIRWVDGEWQRIRWVDGEWQRIRWVDGEWQRIRWVGDEWQRIRWVGDEWQRIRWVDANLARIRWVDDHFARIRWVGNDWAQVQWAGHGWKQDDSWTRIRWVAARWEDRTAP